MVYREFYCRVLLQSALWNACEAPKSTIFCDHHLLIYGSIITKRAMNRLASLLWHVALRRRQMTAMASPITGQSTVCSTVSSTQRDSNAENVFIRWLHTGIFNAESRIIRANLITKFFVTVRVAIICPSQFEMIFVISCCNKWYMRITTVQFVNWSVFHIQG